MNEKMTFVPRKHSISQVFVFVLLGIFAVMSTLMVLLSAQMYRGVVGKTEQNSSYRILTSYVSNAVRLLAKRVISSVRISSPAWAESKRAESSAFSESSPCS